MIKLPEEWPKANLSLGSLSLLQFWRKLIWDINTDIFKIFVSAIIGSKLLKK